MKLFPIIKILVPIFILLISLPTLGADTDKTKFIKDYEDIIKNIITLVGVFITVVGVHISVGPIS